MRITEAVNSSNLESVVPFDEWKSRMIKEQGLATNPNTSQSTDTYNSVRPGGKNYASMECAKVVDANPEAEGTSRVVSEMMDEYMLNPCKAKIWFVIELCEPIHAKHIEIANFELFSSIPKDITVYSGDTYPTTDWAPIGQFTAADSRTLQSFDLHQKGFGKFIRVEMHSHYGKEHYCPISLVRVYGTSMVDDYDLGLKKNTKQSEYKRQQDSKFTVYFRMMIGELGMAALCTDKDCGQPPTQNNITAIASSSALQTSTGHSKESVFVRLSNRVKVLELNVSLSSQYLEELSRRYRRQIDDLQRQLEESINNVKKIEELVHERDIYHWKMLLLLFIIHAVLLILITTIIIVVVRYYVRILLSVID